MAAVSLLLGHSGDTDPGSPGLTHPIPGQLLAEMGTFKLLSGYKKEIQRKSSFVLGADWFPFFLPSPTWKPSGKWRQSRVEVKNALSSGSSVY